MAALLASKLASTSLFLRIRVFLDCLHCFLFFRCTTRLALYFLHRFCFPLHGALDIEALGFWREERRGNVIHVIYVPNVGGLKLDYLCCALLYCGYFLYPYLLSFLSL